MRYAELHCLSNFSFLRGASHPEELVERAAELGYEALAITDRNSLAGVVRAHVAVRRHNASHPDRPLKLIIGAEITPVDGPTLVLLVTDRASYGRLSRLITRGRLRSIKGQCRICMADVTEFAAGLVAIVAWGEAEQGTGTGEQDSAPPRSVVPQAGCVAALHAHFSGRLYLAATLTYDEPDEQRLARLVELSRATGIPLVACNQVHYHVPERRYLQDVLTCIREKCTLATAGRRLFANAERHLRGLEEIGRRYGGKEGNEGRGTGNGEPGRIALAGRAAVARTVEIAAQCHFSLDELRYQYPHELVPSGLTAMQHLERLTWEGAAERYGGGSKQETGNGEREVMKARRREGTEGEENPGGCHSPACLRALEPACLPSSVRELLTTELALIAELGYEHYFLTVWDIVRFARSRGILCQGRGSAANSAVCYCLGITAVDPSRIELLFERFISRERNEPPDIDVDFEHERREEVFQYIYGKYGRERAGITAEVICYRPRSAVRDVGKALGLSLDRVDAIAKTIDWFDREPLPRRTLAHAGLDPDDRTLRLLVGLVKQILGFPRHLSQHVGGFVITETPLCEIVPLENGAMPERTFIEWDKDDIDALGILKVDCLALGMLTALSKGLKMIGNGEPGSGNSGVGVRTVPGSRFPAPSCLHDIPPEDPAVYDMICAADTVGVFQIESRAQMSMLPRLKPRNFYDLVIEVAIVRPGPIQGGMVHPYLKRRDGLERVTYASEAVRGVLGKTLGVPLFQEQVMRLAVVAAGFTPGEADQLRRAMAAWRRNGAIEAFQVKLVQGLLANGYSRDFAERIYKQIQGFGEYGFPESHAASFALLVYASAWLKRYYPAAFAAALLNSQPMGFYTPGQIVRDAIAHGVEVRPVDVNWSGWDCTLEGGQRGTGERGTGGGERDPRQVAVRLGMRLVRGLSAAKVSGIEAARREGPITSIQRLARRGEVSRETLVRLAAADAFRSLGVGRRTALWQILSLEEERFPLFADAGTDAEPAVELPVMSLDETVVCDYDALGMSLSAHPMELVREELTRLRVIRSACLASTPARRRVAVAGLVTCRQHPSTAKGVTFMTLEDESGMANLIIRPKVWERYHLIARSRIALIAEGQVERQGAVVHVMVQRLHDASARIGALRTQSRDFR